MPVHFAGAQTILRVNASNGGACVATPSGVVSTKFCEDGDDGVPIVWAEIPSFLNNAEGTPFSVDLRQYLTEPGMPDATLSMPDCSFPTGWSFDGDDLEYSGTGTGSAVCQVLATRDGDTALSKSFQIEAVADEGDPDTSPPTFIMGVEVVLDESERPIIAFDAPADVRVPDQSASGLDEYTVRRNGTPLTPTAFTGSVSIPTYSSFEIGDAGDAEAVQDGADWTHTAAGGGVLDGTDILFTPTVVTGDMTAAVRVISMTGGSNSERGANLMLREGTAAGGRYVAVHLFPSGNVRCYYRAVTDGAVVQSGLVALGSPAGFLRIARQGDAFTVGASSDGNSFGEVCQLNLGLNATLNAGPATQSNEATPIVVEYGNLTVTTRPRQTFTDTGGSPGDVYTVIADDVAGNVAASSAAFTAPAGSVEEPESDVPDYPFPGIVTLQGGRTTKSVAPNALANELSAASCGTTLQLQSGTYTGNFATSANLDCPANNPFIIRGAATNCFNETTFSSVFTGRFTLAGENNILTCADFSGAGVRIVCLGSSNRAIGNRVRNYTSTAATRTDNSSSDTGVTRCELSYNDIGPYAGDALQQHFAIKDDSTTNEATASTHVWVHHNKIHGHKDGEGNDTDFIEPGNGGVSRPWLQNGNQGWYIEYNRFYDYTDCSQNIIDMKYAGTVIRGNTVANSTTSTGQPCVAKISQRFGWNYLVVSNYLTAGNGSAMILTHGDGATVACNVGIVRVQAGDVSTADLTTNDHHASRNVLVANNNGNVSIGHQPNASYTFPALTTTIQKQLGGNISTGLATGTIDQRDLPSSFKCPQATELPLNRTGPAGLNFADPAYLASRGLTP